MAGSKCSFSSGLSLFLHFSVFISLCWLYSQICSPLLVEVRPPAALSLPTSNLQVLSCPVLPAKISSLVLVPFPEPKAVTKKESVADWPVLSHMYFQGDWQWAQSHWNHKHWERGSFSKENGRTVIRRGRDRCWVKTPECSAAWTSCSQSF